MATDGKFTYPVHQRNSLALPYVKPLSPQQIHTYYQKLQPISFTYYDRPFKYGHPVTIPQSTTWHLVNAANNVQKIVVDAIRKVGLTTWLADHAPRMGKEILNYQPINLQLEKRVLEEGLQLPMVYDGLIALEHGRPCFRVTEIQSCIGYGPSHRVLLQAAGYDPDETATWQGAENPQAVLQRLKSEMASGRDITVIDTDPYHGSGQADQIMMAKALGQEWSLPIPALDIQFDSEAGYYHYRYATDPITGGPVKDKHTGNFVRTDEKIRITHVLARMTQPELDELDRQLADRPLQRALLERFLKDETLTWLQHPAWQYIIDKSTLPFIRRSLSDNNDILQADFVAIYGPGEQVPEGKYIRKPSRGTGGSGQSIKKIAANTSLIVEKDYVYQQFITPYPLPIPLPEDVQGKFSMPAEIATELREGILFIGWQPERTAGSIELRAMALPWGKSQLSLYFQARIAPRYIDPLSREFTQTNIIQMYRAFDRYVADHEYPLLPFGWCPAIIC